MLQLKQVIIEHKKQILKIFIYITALGIWLSWDLYQAHSDSGRFYQSFFNASNAASNESATVSIVRSNDPALANPCGVTDEGITYTTIDQMVRRAVDLAGGLSGIVHSGDTVLIKPNIVQWDSTGSGGVTDVRVVKALVYMVDEIDHGNIRIILGEGSARPYTTFEKASGTSARPWNQLFDVPGYQLLKTEALAAGIDFHISNLNGNSDTDPWPELETVSIPGGGYAQPQSGSYLIHQDVIHATVYINVPVMKIHDQPGFTCALKNQIGLAASSRYGFSKTLGVLQDGRTHKLIHKAQLPYDWQDKEIVDLSIIAKIKLNVVDAITCLEIKKSPMYTLDSINVNIPNRVKMNTVIAGYDPVAVDNVCCRVMGLNPDDIEHITLAERAGLGTNNPDSITVVGTSIEATRRVFKKGQTTYGTYGQSNRIWLLNGYYSTTGIPSPMNYEFITGESSVTPEAGVDGWSEPVYFNHDQIMLKDYYALGTGQTVVSYAFTYFNAPAAQAAELWVGSDEALKIYLNGIVVYNYSGTRTFSGTTFWSSIIDTIHVVEGLNTLLVKYYQSTGNYNFTLNICEVEPDVYYRGNRIWGLKFTTEAPQQTSSVSVFNGWNLVSVPRLQSNWSADVIFPGKNGAIYAYNTSTDVYDSAPTLANGGGYWANYSSTNMIIISGGSPTSSGTSAAKAGWVLVGSREIPIDVSSLILSDGAVINGDAYRYNTSSGHYESTTVINPGDGVWLNVSKACTITIP